MPAIQLDDSVPMFRVSARAMRPKVLHFVHGVDHGRRGAGGKQHIGGDVHRHEVGDVVHERPFGAHLLMKGVNGGKRQGGHRELLARRSPADKKTCGCRTVRAARLNPSAGMIRIRFVGLDRSSQSGQAGTPP